MKHKKEQKNKAFTLIETMIAISILMISIAVPLSLAAKGLEAASLAKRQIVAYYLAQDAYEWIKNKTEYNKNVGTTADKLIDNLENCVDDKKCIVDTTEAITAIPDLYNSGKKLKINSENVYQYAGGSDSIFTRYVNIKKHDKDGNGYVEGVTVTVTVKWQPPYLAEQEYVLKSNITNW